MKLKVIKMQIKKLIRKIIHIYFNVNKTNFLINKVKIPNKIYNLLWFNLFKF